MWYFIYALNDLPNIDDIKKGVLLLSPQMISNLISNFTVNNNSSQKIFKHNSMMFCFKNSDLGASWG